MTQAARPAYVPAPLRLAVLLLAAVCCYNVAQADVDIWVAAGGPAGNGTQTSPYNSADAAFAAAVVPMETENVVLHFNPGYYIVETGLSYYSSNYVIDRNFALVGVNPDDSSPPPVVLDCLGETLNALNINKADFGSLTFSDVEFRNCQRGALLVGDTFTATNVYGRNCSSAVVDGELAEGTLTDCVFEENPNVAITIYNYGSILVQGCTFLNNGQGYDHIGLYVREGNVLSVVNCLFNGNGLVEQAVYTTFVNETIIKNSRGTGLYGIDTSFVYVTQSTIVFNDGGVWADDDYVPVREASERGGPSAAQIMLSNNTIVWQNLQYGNPDIICSNNGRVYLYPGMTNLCGGCPQGSNLDRCFVCGGDDSCLGCDGVPYSGATNCTPATLPSLPFLPSSIVGANGQGGTLLSIHPTLMYALLTPATSLGQPILPSFDLAIYLVSITERRPDGSVYQDYDFTTWPFFLSSSGVVQIQGQNATETIYDYFFSTGTTHITITWFYFPDQVNLTDHGVPFTLAPQNLKITLQIDDWPFEDGNLTTNTLEVVIRTQNSEPISGTVDVVQPLQGNFSLIQRFVDTQHTLCTFSFLNFAYFERLYDSQLENIELAELTNQSDAQNTFFVFKFPGFFWSMHYDPDFSVTLTGNPQGGTGDGDDNLGLIIGLSVGLPLAALIVVGVMVAGTVVLIFQRKRLVRRMTAGTGGSGDM